MSRPRFLKRLGLALAAVSLSALGAVIWLNWGDLLRTDQPGSEPQPTPETIAQGEYLSRIGHCIACHSTRDGRQLAGGRAIATPFGAVYSSNLTPDLDTGLGRWTADDFWRALRFGRSRDGRLLAPAFPYEHTSLLTREDSDAILAWLRMQPAQRNTVPKHDLVWPVGTQAALAVWRTLFFRPETFIPDPTQSDAWNRGAYLVRGPGLCAACHGPRNAWGAGRGTESLSGGWMNPANWYAPSLVSDAQTGLASTPLDEIVRLLQTGISHAASTSGPMAEVVQQSLQHMRSEDLRAMSIYLQSRAQRSQSQATARSDAPDTATIDRRVGLATYERHCADCHGQSGEGKPGAYPALKGNRAVLLDDPTNLVQVVLYGGYAPVTQGNPMPYGMPPFVLELDDREIAATLSYLRTALQADGVSAPGVSVQQVRRIRDRPGR